MILSHVKDQALHLTQILSFLKKADAMPSMSHESCIELNVIDTRTLVHCSSVLEHMYHSVM
jgi:hypothetical protein